MGVNFFCHQDRTVAIVLIAAHFLMQNLLISICSGGAVSRWPGRLSTCIDGGQNYVTVGPVASFATHADRVSVQRDSTLSSFVLLNQWYDPRYMTTATSRVQPPPSRQHPQRGLANM